MSGSDSDSDKKKAVEGSRHSSARSSRKGSGKSRKSDKKSRHGSRSSSSSSSSSSDSDGSKRSGKERKHKKKKDKRPSSKQSVKDETPAAPVVEAEPVKEEPPVIEEPVAEPEPVVEEPVVEEPVVEEPVVKEEEPVVEEEVVKDVEPVVEEAPAKEENTDEVVFRIDGVAEEETKVAEAVVEEVVEEKKEEEPVVAEPVEETNGLGLSDEDLERYRKVFDRKAVDGRLDLKGYKILFRWLGEVVTSEESEANFNNGDKDDNGTIDFPEFCKLYIKFSTKDQERKEGMLKAIDKLFPEAELSLKKVEQLLMKLQQPDLKMRVVREKSDLTNRDVKHFVKVMDTDGSGMISKDEFVNQMCEHMSVVQD